MNSAPIHAPVGLDVGAETVEEVAVSIVSELLAVRSARPG
jgi:xanthine dehydrogenase accessory factor